MDTLCLSTYCLSYRSHSVKEFKIVITTSIPLHVFVTEGKSRRSVRRVVCLQTKHLQENYESWAKELKEIERRTKGHRGSGSKSNGILSSSNTGSSDDSSTPVLNATQDQESTENDEDDGS